MVSFECIVGFEHEPKGLDVFLKKQGYNPRPAGSKERYESQNGSPIDIIYGAREEVEENEIPAWEEEGFEVQYELLISTKEERFQKEAQRLADETARAYDAVRCDLDMNDYWKY